MFISVVIPTYNRRDILEKGLRSLDCQSACSEIDEYEVVVVDDGSTDGTPDWLRSSAGAFSRVRLIEQSHGGPAEGRNRGVAHARGDVIVFIDSDVNGKNAIFWEEFVERLFLSLCALDRC